MVGSRDFSLLGRPLLPRDLTQVTATVVDRNISRTHVTFRMPDTMRRGKTYCEGKNIIKTELVAF